MPHRFLLVVLAFVPSLAFAQLPPEKALATLKVPDDLQVELFASEPMFSNPTSIDVDHKGRVWVCESVNYRTNLRRTKPNRPEGDRIVVLEDTDGDGKADKATTFYQAPDLLAPLGIAVAPLMVSPGRKAGEGVRVFVCHSPHIYVFDDKDGDLKADGPPKILLTGFQGYDHDHGVHGVNIGPDGKLYFTVGDAGVRDLQSSDAKGRKWSSNSTDCRAGTVWRCDVDGKNLELIAHNFRNNYECCVNSFGEIWLSDNDDDGNQQTRICFVMPGGDYGYHPRGPGQSHWHEEQPGIVHKVLRTGFGSPTGICFYEGSLLPKRFHGQLLHTDAGPRECRCFHLKPKGAGYEAEKELLVTSSDNWFRLSDVCVAPDGSVILSDWYDPGVGGHGMGDTTRGRIYRVTPKGHKGYKIPDFSVASQQGFLAALGNPCLSARAGAIGVLPQMKPIHARDWLDHGLKGRDNPWGQSRALWQLDRLVRYSNEVSEENKRHVVAGGEWRSMFEQQRLRMDAPHIREEGAFDELRSRIGSVRSATNPMASARELALSLAPLLPESASVAFYPLAQLYDGTDRFYLAALNIACGTDPKRREAILADFDKHFPELDDRTLNLIWELRPKSVMARLGQMLAKPGIRMAQRDRILEVLAAGNDPSTAKVVVNLLSQSNAQPGVNESAWRVLSANLPTRWASLKDDPDLDRLIDHWFRAGNELERSRAFDLIRLGVLTKHARFTRNAAANNAEHEQPRIAAIRALEVFKTKADVDTLARVLNDEEATRFSGVVIESLGRMHTPDALGLLQRLVTNPKSSELRRQASLAALAASRPGSDWLLKLKESGMMPESLVADAGRLLRNSPFQGQRNKAMLLFPPPGKLDPKKFPAIAVLAKRQGDAEKGRKLLAATLTNEAQCLKCHTVRGVGGQVGPDLSMIGKKASRENLIESILLPSKAIADQFIQWRVETKNGQDITGLLIEETKESLLLRDANAKDHRIPIANIESRAKSTVSIMPENIVAALTEDELIDLVEYLATLNTASFTPDTWLLAGPFAANGNDGLDKDFGPERAFNGAATFETKSGKVGWRTVRRADNGYIDLAAFHGDPGNNSVSYAYREIESPVDQEAEIALGTDDGGKLWVNGKEVFALKTTRAAAAEQNRVKVPLIKGRNTILLKIANGNNPHGFYCTIRTEQEVK